MRTNPLARWLAAPLAFAALSTAALAQAEIVRLRTFGHPDFDEWMLATDSAADGRRALAYWTISSPTRVLLSVFSPDTTLLWSSPLPAPSANAYSGPVLSMADDGSVFAMCVADDTTGRPTTRVWRFTPTGILQWMWEYSASANEAVLGRSMSIDDEGNVAVAGYATPWPTAPDYNDVIVVGVSALGATEWQFRLDAPPLVLQRALAIARAPGGDLCVGGWTRFATNQHPYDFFLMRLSNAGALRWFEHLSPQPFLGLDPIAAGIVPADDRVALVGYVAPPGPGYFWSWVMVREGDGRAAWTFSDPGLVPGYPVAFSGARFEAAGSMLLSGTAFTFDTTQSGFRLVLVRLDADGDLLDFTLWGPTEPSLFGASGGQLQLGLGGDVLVGAGPYVQQYDAALGQTWSLRLGSDQSRPLVVADFARASPTELVAVGWMSLPAPFAAQDDLFIAHIDIGDAPRGYCEPGLNALGCAQRLTYTGASSASAASGFELRIGEVRNHARAILLYGFDGPLHAPFGASELCVRSPHARTPLLDAGGNALPADDCSGALAIDWNAFASGALGGSPSPALAIAGMHVWIQAWIADRGLPAGATLSSAFTYAVQP